MSKEQDIRTTVLTALPGPDDAPITGTEFQARCVNAGLDAASAWQGFGGCEQDGLVNWSKHEGGVRMIRRSEKARIV